MATHKSAEKRARQALVRRERNRTIKSGVKTRIKAFRAATESGDAADAKEKFDAAERALRVAGSKGVLPQSRVSRRVSRLAKRLNALPSKATASAAKRRAQRAKGERSRARRTVPSPAAREPCPGGCPPAL